MFQGSRAFLATYRACSQVSLVLASPAPASCCVEHLGRPGLLCYMLMSVGSLNAKLKQTQSTGNESIIPEGGRLGCCNRLAEQAGCWGGVGALLALLPLLCQLVQPLQVHVRSHRIPLRGPHMLTMQYLPSPYWVVTMHDCSLATCKTQKAAALDLVVWADHTGQAQRVCACWHLSGHATAQHCSAAASHLLPGSGDNCCTAIWPIMRGTRRCSLVIIGLALVCASFETGSIHIPIFILIITVALSCSAILQTFPLLSQLDLLQQPGMVLLSELEAIIGSCFQTIQAC